MILLRTLTDTLDSATSEMRVRKRLSLTSSATRDLMMPSLMASPWETKRAVQRSMTMSTMGLERAESSL